MLLKGFLLLRLLNGVGDVGDGVGDEELWLFLEFYLDSFLLFWLFCSGE